MASATPRHTESSATDEGDTIMMLVALIKVFKWLVKMNVPGARWQRHTRRSRLTMHVIVSLPLAASQLMHICRNVTTHREKYNDAMSKTQAKTSTLSSTLTTMVHRTRSSSSTRGKWMTRGHRSRLIRRIILLDSSSRRSLRPSSRVGRIYPIGSVNYRMSPFLKPRLRDYLNHLHDIRSMNNPLMDRNRHR
jgi:hypothetical protein